MFQILVDLIFIGPGVNKPHEMLESEIVCHNVKDWGGSRVGGFAFRILT